MEEQAKRNNHIQVLIRLKKMYQ